MEDEEKDIPTPSPHLKRDLPKGRVTLRQLRMVTNLPTAKTIKDAAIASGYKSGNGVMKRLEENKSLSEAFSEAGLSPSFIAEVYAQIIEEGKPFEKLKALELISKIRGDFAATKTITATANLEDIILAHHKGEAEVVEESEEDTDG